MEISTVLGLIIGFAMMVGVLMVGESHVSLTKFIDPPAMMMVFGGAIAVTLVGFPLKQVLNIFSILKKPFFAKPDNPSELIEQIVSLAETAQGRAARPGREDEGDQEPVHRPGHSTLRRRHAQRGRRGNHADGGRGRRGATSRGEEDSRIDGPLRAGLRHDRHAAWA